MIVRTDTLPDWVFVGGGFQTYEFVLRSENGAYYDLPNAKVYLDVADYMDPTHLVLQMNVTTSKHPVSGASCLASFSLTPVATANLSGRFIYQITVESADGVIAPPMRGRMFVTKNINQMV